MSKSVSRRKFIQKASAAAVVGLTSNSVFASSKKILIVGVSCSPRQGKTTVAAPAFWINFRRLTEFDIILPPLLKSHSLWIACLIYHYQMAIVTDSPLLEFL